MSIKFSAVINCYNEEDFIQYAIESIEPYVDEIVIVDNCSTDGTVRILNELSKKLPYSEKIKLYCLDSPKQLADARNFAMDQASNEWIVKWDGDFCAYDDEDTKHTSCESFSKLISLIEETHESFDIYLLYSINICGDLYHFDKTRQYLGLSGDSFIGRRSCISYGVNEKYGDVGILKRPDGYTPRYYRLNNPEKDPMYFLHIYGVKNDQYLLYRRFLSEYQVWIARNEHKEFWDWMKTEKQYNTENGLAHVKSKIIENMEKHNLPIPKILNPIIDNPKYLIKYENEKIIERLELY